MKKYALIPLCLCISILFSFSYKAEPINTDPYIMEDTSGLIKIFLENKCGHDVKVKAERPGMASMYTISAGSKKPLSFPEGTKIYSGDNLIVEVTADETGKNFTVCE